MTELILVMLGLSGASLALTLLTHGAVLAAMRRRPQASLFPGISVLKPVKGAEPFLYENLASLARQTYPNFEILIGAEDPGDPALGVARQVRRDFPNVRIRIVSGARAIGHNPKVSNLSMLSEYAEHDWVLISDSSVRAEPNYLRIMACELADSRVELVSSMLSSVGGAGVGALLDNLLMNTMASRAVAASHLVFSHACVIGKSMLFRLSTFKGLGGFQAVKDVLAEDYVMGRLFQNAGHRVALAREPLETLSTQRTFSDFCARHLRWAQMRRHLNIAYFGEPLLTPLPWLSLAVLVAYGSQTSFSPKAVLGWAASALLLRTVSDVLVLRALSRRWVEPEEVLGLVAKDAVLLVIWGVAIFKRRVNWRGNELVIGAGSRLSSAPERATRALAGGT